MEPTKLPVDLLKPQAPEGTHGLFATGAADPTSLKVAQRSLQLIAPATQQISSGTRPSTEYVAAAVGSCTKAQRASVKAASSQGATSVIKTSNVLAATLKGAAYASYSATQPLNFVAAIKGMAVSPTSPSLIGRVSYNLSSLALQFRNIAATLFMMVTGYKIYENAKWARLSEKEFYDKIQAPTVDQMDVNHKDSEALKNLVYTYFEDKVGEILKKGSEQGLKVSLNKEGLKKNLDAKLKELLDDESSGFIKDQESWALCQEKRSDPVEAFGLYIELMLARQSHQKEIKRVFGKDGLELLKANSSDLYAQAMSVCKRRLILDTLNFVLGVGVMSVVAFTVSATLALPLLVKISKDSPTFEYIQFIFKTFILGSVIFTPYGLLSLVTFNLGLSVYSLVTGGTKVPFMSSKEMDNYTRWDKLLIQFNIILGALSIFSTGFMGLYVDVPALTTAALASTQLPWIGLNMYGLSEIWKREEAKKEMIREQIKKIAKEEEGIKEYIKDLCEGDRDKSLSALFEEYHFSSIEKAYLESVEIRNIPGFETDDAIKQTLKEHYLAKYTIDRGILSSEDFFKRYRDKSKEAQLKQLARSWFEEYDFGLIRKACLTSPDIRAIKGFATEDDIEEQLEIERDDQKDRQAVQQREEIKQSIKALIQAGFVTVDQSMDRRHPIRRGGSSHRVYRM